MTQPATVPPLPASPARAKSYGVRRRIRNAAVTLAPLSIAAVLVYLRFFAPVSAVSHRVERGLVVEHVFGRGTIESEREAQLGFDLVGRISEVLVDEGARVTLGQELARLTPDQVEANLRVASRGLAAARTSLGTLAADEHRALTAIDVAEREQRRAQTLRDRGAIAQQELDGATDRLRLARADLDRVLAQRAAATRSIEVAAGGAEQRRVTVLRATLLAPFDGLVTRRLREPGDTVAVGTSVLRIVDTDQVHVSAWIDETVLSRLHEDQPAEIVAPGAPGGALAGRVVDIGWESDRQTHEILVDVAPTHPLGRVAVGQRADVWIELARRERAVRVPVSFLARDAAGPYCNVDRNGRVVRARVHTGIADRDVVEVTSGLTEGDVALRAPTPGDELPEGRRWRTR
jgi:HlyD family secretion protein